MTVKNLEILEKEPIYDGFFRLSKITLRHALHDGGWSAVMERELFERDPVVAVLPYDPVADKVLLIEQFRAPGHWNGMNLWQTEIVAGIVEPGEDLEQVAMRESQEEAACTPKKLERVMTFMPSQGACTEIVTLFAAWIESEGLGGIHGLDHEHEDILARVVDFSEAVRMLEEGKIQNSPAIIALQWLQMNRERLRATWR